MTPLLTRRLGRKSPPTTLLDTKESLRSDVTTVTNLDTFFATVRTAASLIHVPYVEALVIAHRIVLEKKR